MGKGVCGFKYGVGACSSRNTFAADQLSHPMGFPQISCSVK